MQQCNNEQDNKKKDSVIPTGLEASGSNDLEEFLRTKLIEDRKDRTLMLNIEKSLVDFLNDEKFVFYLFVFRLKRKRNWFLF